jgi:hypothetical protein
MRVLCKASDVSSDVRCDVCGQGFTVYYARTSPQGEAQVMANVAAALKDHHGSCAAGTGPGADEFHLAEWVSELTFGGKGRWTGLASEYGYN